VDVVKAENKGIGFNLQLTEDEHVGGSDHASFFNKKIPFIFFFAGLHPDYHTVRDNPDSINPEKAARISQLVFKTAWSVANSSKRYQVIEKK
jgi:Zn-dependent M28 family amino/carboxypeptidase